MDKRVREISRFFVALRREFAPPSGASHKLLYPEIPPAQYKVTDALK